MPGPTPHPYIKAFACAGIIVATVIVAAGGISLNSDRAVRALAQLIVGVGLGAIATGYLARKSIKAWSIGRIAATFVVVSVFTFMLVLGTARH